MFIRRFTAVTSSVTTPAYFAANRWMVTMYHRYEPQKDTVVQSPEPLGGYKIPLAVHLYERLSIEPGKAGRQMFLADLLKSLGSGPCDMFPDTSSKIAREMRIARTLQSFVQVNDVVLHFENAEKKHMYQKTKTVVARLTTLLALGVPQIKEPIYSAESQSYRSSPHASYDEGAARLAALEARLSALEIGLLESGPSAVATGAPDPRILELERVCGVLKPQIFMLGQRLAKLEDLNPKDGQP